MITMAVKKQTKPKGVQASGLTTTELMEAQAKDDQCAALTRLIKEGNQRVTRLYMLDGILYRQSSDKWEQRRIVIPDALKIYILREFHGNGLAGHSGKNRTLALLGEHFSWKGMYTDVTKFINACILCRGRKRPKPNRQGEVGQLIVDHPYDTIAMDIVVGLPDDNGYKHILTAIDVFTRYAWAIPLRSREASEVADALAKNLFHHHGSFRTLRTDNEKAFLSDIIRRLLQQWGIAHLTTVPYHSESNGHVERLHRFIETQLTILATKKREWTQHIQAAVFTYNIGVHASTGHSPYFLFHGRRPRLPIECIIKEDRKEYDQNGYANILTQTITEAYREARKTQRKVADQRKEAQKGHRVPTTFKPDDLVMYHESQRGTTAKHIPPKMATNASGPHKVLRRIDSNRYVILHRGRNAEVIVSIKDISIFHPFENDEDPTAIELRLQVGDLAVIPLKEKGGYHPWYIARILRITKTVTLQWYGNIDHILIGDQYPEWRDGKTSYFSVTPDKKNHKAVTNRVTGPARITPEQIRIFGFKLTEDNRLKPETIAAIDAEPSIDWQLDE